jgi:hypothetical protein
VRTRISLLGVTALTLSVCALGAAAPAMASTTGAPHVVRPRGCSTPYAYQYTKVTNVNQADPADTSSGENGITLTVTITNGQTVTGTVGGSAGFDLDAIVAGANASVNGSISYSKTSSVTKSYQWKVTGGAEGTLYVGAQDKKMDWQYGYVNSGCKYVEAQHGTAKLPYKLPYSWHVAS